MALKKYTLNSSHTQPRIKALIYGAPGSGKTTFAATAARHPAMGPVLLANIDKGALSIASVPGIDAVDVTTIQDFEDLFWALAGNSEEFRGYKTVILDGLSDLQKIDMEEIAARALKKDPAKRESIDHRQIEDYGESISRLQRIARQYRDLANRPENPLHIIGTAWAKETYPKVDTRKVQKANLAPLSVTPDLSEKLARSIAGYMDFLWYMTVGDDGARWLLTQTQSPYLAKTRGAKFAEAIGKAVKDPDMGTLYDTFCREEFGAQNDPA